MYLINTYAFAQLQLSVSTDKQTYNYGENIIIECSVKNMADTTAIIWAGSFQSCQAEFSFNSFNSWEHTDCLTLTERIEIKPGNSRVYKWTIDPKIYGLPNKDGEQKIVGYFLGGLKDSITINAPKYYGGQISVGFFDSLETEINLLKDTLNVEVLSRSDYGSLGISENWQIEGFIVDSLVEQYSNDKRFRYAENSVFSTYDSIYTTSPLSYYPLHVGDKWYYHVKFVEYAFDYSTTETNYNISREVTKDTVMKNDKNYFEIKEFRNDSLIESYTYERIDSVSGKIFLFDESSSDSSEYLVENLELKINENFNSWGKYENEYWEENTTFHENVLLEIFENDSVILDSKRYESNGYEWNEYYLSKGIGKSYQYGGIIDGYDRTFSLLAAKINNKFYGDTTLVGIEKKSKSISNDFLLYQNYPNPFNPSTIISFTIPQKLAGQRTIITVYNIQGEVIKTLLDEKLQTGTYLTRWNGTNNRNYQVSSGIYLYEVKVGIQKFLGKMNLMK